MAAPVPPTSSTSLSPRSPSRFAIVEVGLIVALIFALSGTPPPDVNEAHYLAKAKHYWNPEWCSRDLFLQSADAHFTFVWAFGWVTRFASLNTTAWIGRVVTWVLLAWSWRRLSTAIVPGGRLTAVWSAALFAALVHWGQMAGEWIFGGVEAKGFAYALMFFSLEALARERWRTAVLLGGAATAFHVLVGGWTLAAMAIAWLLSVKGQRPPLRTLAPALVLAVFLAMPGLIPGLALSLNSDAETVREANRIYVFERLPHHLVFHRLPHAAIARHGFLIGVFLLTGLWFRNKRETPLLPHSLSCFVVGAIMIAMAGASLDQGLLYFRPLAAGVLKFYWFRLSDVAAPLGVTWALVTWQGRLAKGQPVTASWMLGGLWLVAGAHVAWAVYHNWTDPRPGAVAQALPAADLPREERIRRWSEWREVCSWVEANTPADELFLTPRNQQTFKWDANRAEVVNGKDFPQDARAIIAWRKRMDDVFPYTVRFADLVAHGEQRLRELSEKYGFRYIIIDRGSSAGALGFPRVFPDPADPAKYVYEVYRVVQ